MAELAAMGGFFLLTLAILIVPGPDVLFVMARSLAQGRRAGLLSVLGIGGGVLVHTVLAAIGLSQLFLAVPAAYNLVRYAGVAYLLYLAYRILREPPAETTLVAPRHDSPGRLIGQAFLTNLLNPKAALFFVAFLPQFAQSRAGDALFGELLYLGLIVVALSMLINALYALVAASAAAYVRRNARVERAQRWISAGILGVIALLAARAAFPGDS